MRQALRDVETAAAACGMGVWLLGMLAASRAAGVSMAELGMRALFALAAAAVAVAAMYALERHGQRRARGRATIFISHPREAVSMELATRLGGDLSRDGYRVFVSGTELPPGEPIDDARLCRLLKRSDCVIALIAYEVRPSPVFERELRLARAAARRIIPVIVGDGAVPEVVVNLAPLEVPRVDEARSYRSAYRMLEGTIRRGRPAVVGA